MALCLVFRCSATNNAPGDRFCRTCGAPLLLKGRYRAIRPLGQGGFGRTFLAENVAQPDAPKCVIKQLHQLANSEANAQALRMFHQEAVRLEQLRDHPQIPKLLAHFDQGEHQYLIQEYIDGWDLQSEVQTEGAFDEAKIWQLLEEISQILRFVHQHRIIHRDIKPTNIMRRRQGGQLVLIDFGVAKLFKHSELAQTGTLVGSPEYMSPEQTRGKVVNSSDLYSLGVTCLYLMCRRSPLELYSPANDFWYWREALPEGRRFSPRLGEILDRLLQTPINRRFPSAQSLADHVAAYRATWTGGVPTGPTFALAAGAAAPVSPSGNWQQYLTEVDYEPLAQLLCEQRWCEADQLTWQNLAEALGKTGPYVPIGDLAKLPCGDLERLDLLWRRYSGDRFGFSRQAAIFAQSQDFGKFCQAVGWEIVQGRVRQLIYSLDAPLGHLPSCQWLSGSQWWKYSQLMAQRLLVCGIGDALGDVVGGNSAGGGK